MDPRFVREVERHLKNFTRGGYHKQLLERKDLMWPQIERVLIDKGLPVELGFIVWVESNFQPDAISPVGAFGPWQFMPETAKEYNLRVSRTNDERRDLSKSTAAAADYFTDLLRMFGTERYLLAVASYNTGQNRVKRLQIAATVNKERSSDFWQIRYMLPKETAEYVPKFMAAVIIGRNPKRWDVSH
jgi:membrane-bound lytic murein transglycosylase D